MNNKFGVEYHLVDSCNLRCAGCSHYSSLLDDLSYTPLEKVQKELQLLKSKTDDGNHLYWLRLLGGEPLLHPCLSQCIEEIRDLFPHTRITLVTNGLLLDKMDSEFYNVCSRCKIVIQVTDYYILNIQEVFDHLKEKGVEVELYRTCKTWNYQNIRITNEYVDCFKNCYHKTMCPNYRNEKIYLCPQMAYVDIFNRFFNKEIPILDNEYIDINNIGSFEELYNTFINLHPQFCSTFCNCRGEDGNPLLEGKRRRTLKDINEFCLCTNK